MIKQKTKKNKEKSYRLWKFYVARKWREANRKSRASKRFAYENFHRNSLNPLQAPQHKRGRGKGHESAAWRRSRTTIATQENKTVDAQNLKEEGSRGRFCFFPAHLPRTTPSTFLSCWIGIGSPDLSFYTPCPFPVARVLGRCQKPF
jgi:hypothetical protein